MRAEWGKESEIIVKLCQSAASKQLNCVCLEAGWSGGCLELDM